jgi:rSAM/selenodomain-associated transferase 1
MSRAIRDTGVAILAKAPRPGLAKTRLSPAIGAHAAAVLQERLTERTVETACAAALGPVTLWTAPDPAHRSFADLAARYPLTLRRQPEDDLGARMFAAMQDGPTLAIGTDCPALTTGHLQTAAQMLTETDVALIPAEDGGYVLIGTNAPAPKLFSAVDWGTPQVLAQTRQRIRDAGLICCELDALWDVDEPADLDRLERIYPELRL